MIVIIAKDAERHSMHAGIAAIGMAKETVSIATHLNMNILKQFVWPILLVLICGILNWLMIIGIPRMESKDRCRCEPVAFHFDQTTCYCNPK